MELGKRIKEYRNSLKMNQEELAEKMFVSRQTISNWENDKSYPDIQSLLLLSNLFDVSLDQLVKGDVEIMKEIVNEQEVKKFNYYGKMLTVHWIIMIVSVVPLFLWLNYWALIPFGMIWCALMFWGYKVEKLKKENDIQTYKEIVAFSNGEKLDEITKQREIGKRPYQKVFIVIGFTAVFAVLCLVIGLIFVAFDFFVLS